MLSGYRLMWMMVMFDLPVVHEDDRRAYTLFHKFLLKQGFSMCQYSVYARFCGARERTERIYKEVSSHLPAKGKINILMFTDKQFGSIIHFENHTRKKSKENPDQLLIFSDD